MGDPSLPPPTPRPGPGDDSSTLSIQREILDSLSQIAKHTEDMVTLIPAQSKAISDQLAAYPSGPSKPSSTTPVGVGPSTGASVGSDPMGGPFSWLHYPGTRPTPVDYFQMLGAGASQLGQASINRKLSAAVQQAVSAGDVLGGTQINRQGQVVDAQGAPVTDLPQDLAQKLQGLQSQGTGTSGFMGKTADVFSGLAGGYVTGRKIQGLLQDVTAPFNNAMNLGYETGASGGSPGFLGMRAPWDPGVIAGASQFINRIGFALGHNVTPGQAGTIYSNLYQNGWLAGPQTNAMRLAGGQIMQDNSVLGSMPQVYSMMDQSTRMGTASLSQFVNLMKQVPDAMQASHTSMTQTLADWQQLGQAAKEQGGTFYQGMMLGNAWQHVTGLPAASVMPFLNNPIVQGQTFLHTGLMPWEQSLAPAGSRINSIMDSIGMMRNVINTRRPITENLGGGFSSTISGNQQDFALMSHFFGVDSSTLQNLYSHRAGIRAGSNLWGWTEAWKNSKHPNVALQSATASGNWGKIRQALHQAMYQGNDNKAHHMFSQHEQQQIADVQRNTVDRWWSAHPGAHLRSHPGDTSLGQIESKIMGGGYQDGYYKLGNKVYDITSPSFGAQPNARQVTGSLAHNISKTQLHDMESGKGPLPKGLAETILHNRAAKIQQILGQHNGQNSPAGTNITISLSKAAQKMFNLNDPKGQFKAGRNAGTISVNMNPNATGPTTSPQPDLNTADSYGQYSSGQPFYPPGYASGANTNNGQ